MRAKVQLRELTAEERQAVERLARSRLGALQQIAQRRRFNPAIER